jgi:hypothetical protein
MDIEKNQIERREEAIILYIVEAISKNGFWFKIKAGVNFKLEDYADISRT